MARMCEAFSSPRIRRAGRTIADGNALRDADVKTARERAEEKRQAKLDVVREQAGRTGRW